MFRSPVRRNVGVRTKITLKAAATLKGSFGKPYGRSMRTDTGPSSDLSCLVAEPTRAPPVIPRTPRARTSHSVYAQIISRTD